LLQKGRDTVSGLYDGAAKTAKRVQRILPKLPRDLRMTSGRQSVYTMFEEHPLVVGAVGVGVGIALASLLPSFESKNRRHKQR
jgi:uncharacterized membrane protein YedE/YeeE